MKKSTSVNPLRAFFIPSGVHGFLKFLYNCLHLRNNRRDTLRRLSISTEYAIHLNFFNWLFYDTKKEKV